MIRLFRVFIPLASVTLLAAEALLITGAYLAASFAVVEVDPTVYLLYDGGLNQVGLAVLSILLGLYFQDLYSQLQVKSRIRLGQQISVVIGSAILLQGLLSYADQELRLPVPVMLLGSAIAAPAIFAGRLLFSRYSQFVIARQRLVMFGGSRLLEELGEMIAERPEAGLAVAGYVDDVHTPGDEIAGSKCLGASAVLREVVASLRPDRVVVGIAGRLSATSLEDLLDLQLAGAQIEPATETYERLRSRVCLRELRPGDLICSGELDPHRRHVFYQGILNVVVAAAVLVVASPLILLIAALVRLSSPGPVFHREVRVGLRGLPFELYRFRTMRVEPASAAPAPGSKPGNNPRLTRFGRILRRLGMDELPSFLNVLKGDLSLVGPRAERPEFVSALARHIPFYAQRHAVRPGMTGWAQINQDRRSQVEDTLEKLEFDLYYVKNMSPSLDAAIIFHTLKRLWA